MMSRPGSSHGRLWGLCSLAEASETRGTPSGSFRSGVCFSSSRTGMAVGACDLSVRLESIVNDFRNLLGEIVGDAEVFSKEANLALNVAIHEHLSGMVGDVDLQCDLGRSGDGRHFALLLA